MKKTWLFIVMAAVLVLTACKPKSIITSDTIEPTAAQTTPTLAVTPTEATIVSSSIPSVCTVTTFFPTPEPTEAAVISLFAPVTEADHTLGDAAARVTFLEYSDFQ